MDNLAILKGLTIPLPPDLEQIRKQNARRRRRFLVYSLLVSLAVEGVSCFMLWIWKGTGQWEGFWNVNTLYFLLVLLVPIMFIYAGARAVNRRAQLQEAELRAPAQILRQAALAGDETKAPLATPQPTPLEDGTLLTTPLHLGPLYRPDKARRDSSIGRELAISGGGTVVVLGGFVLMALGQVLPEALIYAIIWSVGIGAMLLVWAWERALKKITVTVDEQGLQWKLLYWRLPSPTLRLAWQDARAFYTFDYEQRSTLGGYSWRIYVLDAPAATLAWAVEVPHRYARQSVFAEQSIHERLAQVIVTRTGLPLRTLATAAGELARELARQPLRPGTRDADTQAGVSERPPQPQTRWLRRWYPLMPPLALLVLLPLTAWGVQSYYTSYYGSLLARARSHHPLYYRATTDADNFVFVNSVYEWQAAFAPNVYGDAAVEVTVRLPKDTAASFGLILHADSAAGRQVVFKLDLNGYWSLGAIDANPNIFMSTNTVNAAPGAPNRLTVIMRGNQYICYVNDTFLAIYQEAQPTTGQVGIFVDGAYVLGMATFSDFTVYPL
jgi:protein-S-isoprenylcysteine O-methyltransferase Ste14